MSHSTRVSKQVEREMWVPELGVAVHELADLAELNGVLCPVGIDVAQAVRDFGVELVPPDEERVDVGTLDLGHPPLIGSELFLDKALLHSVDGGSVLEECNAALELPRFGQPTRGELLVQDLQHVA
jgi:hypothetical protein